VTKSVKSVAAETERQSDKLGKCIKCNMMQRLDKCVTKMSGRILVTNEEKQLYLFVAIALIGAIIQEDISLDTDAITVEERLLSDDSFHFTYDSNNTVDSITRPN